ncbi:unnamed protein product [Caenorhabditis bovis]|uniref:Platelet-derived growth factor (PDGF) family profile domain-containing protein n=1 Tax=Caenorhabditis bovis TaxID=2654633 RepID=A0A8S1ER23_9PELO|nr:unnamed protein product [Caenorhabditis bovis]
MYHPELTNRHIEKDIPPTAQPVQLLASSIHSKSNVDSSGLTYDMDDHTFGHLQNINEIRQGNDTCKLQSVCVPIPQISDDPQVVIYPRCYEVDQCVGSCCDAVESCHPHTVNLVKKSIVELVYIGNNRFMINTTKEITMEEHTSCSCFDCGANTPSCPPGFKVGRSCKCECENKDKRNDCVGAEVWNPDLCKCQCDLKCTSKNFVLNEKSCECVKKRKHGLHHHRHHGHSSRSHPIPKEEIAKIDKLKVGRIGFN